MASALVFGLGAITAGVVGRQLYRGGYIGGKKLADEWVKGGFKAKLDRKEAIAILGLKCVLSSLFHPLDGILNGIFSGLQGRPKDEDAAERRAPTHHAVKPSRQRGLALSSE